jgi:hypothetical protein
LPIHDKAVAAAYRGDTAWGTGQPEGRFQEEAMKFKLGLAIGAGAGYLVGSGKGRELVDSMKRSWDKAGTETSTTPSKPASTSTDPEMARRLAS